MLQPFYSTLRRCFSSWHTSFVLRPEQRISKSILPHCMEVHIQLFSTSWRPDVKYSLRDMYFLHQVYHLLDEFFSIPRMPPSVFRKDRDSNFSVLHGPTIFNDISVICVTARQSVNIDCSSLWSMCYQVSCGNQLYYYSSLSYQSPLFMTLAISSTCKHSFRCQTPSESSLLLLPASCQSINEI